jgi:hypothetical protein
MVYSTPHASQAVTLPSPTYFPVLSSVGILSVHTNVGSRNYLKTFPSDKRFDRVDRRHVGWEAFSAVIPTTNVISFRHLAIRYVALIVVFSVVLRFVLFLNKLLVNGMILLYHTLIILIQFNSFQLFIIYVPSQQLRGQLQTQHSVDISNYIMGEHNLKSKSNER